MRRIGTGLAALLLALGAWLPPPAARAAGAFPDVALIEGNLVRGVSTKTDVRRLLGLPDGTGGALFPPGYDPERVWFYEDIEVLGTSSSGDVMRLGMRQQILLVFFRGATFDGFAWSSSIMPGEMR